MQSAMGRKSTTVGSTLSTQTSSTAGRLAWAGFGLCVASLTCMLISFCSPYWLQCWPMAENRVTNMGLWQVCLYNYKQFKDDSRDTYDGCWSVMDDATRYFKLREWLTPPWFVSCQVLTTACLVFELISAVLTGVVFLHCCPRSARNHEHLQVYGIYVSASLSLVVSLTSVVVAIIFGVHSNDRYWLPRPDQNFLSWGYIFLIVSGILALASGMLFLLEGRRMGAGTSIRKNEIQRQTSEAYAVPYEHEQSSCIPVYDQREDHSFSGLKEVKERLGSGTESRFTGNSVEGPTGKAEARRGASPASGYGDLGDVSVHQLGDISRTMELLCSRSSSAFEYTTDVRTEGVCRGDSAYKSRNL